MVDESNGDPTHLSADPACGGRESCRSRSSTAELDYLEYTSSPNAPLTVSQWTESPQIMVSPIAEEVNYDIGMTDPTFGRIRAEFHHAGRSPITAGNVYDTSDGSLSQVGVGSHATGSCDDSSTATVEADQATYDNSGQLTTLGLQFDVTCGAGPTSTRAPSPTISRPALHIRGTT